MRNFRKTRKRGGQQFTPNIFQCVPAPPGTSAYDAADTCAEEFALSQGWSVINTQDNGNCFYDSIAKYYQKTRNPDPNKRTHLKLRQLIINWIIANRAQYAHIFVSENPSVPTPTNAEVLTELRQYLRPYQWVGPLGDVVPSVAPVVLQINITIYDVRPNGAVNMIAMGTGVDGGPNPALPTINLVRTMDNHFRLLWPTGAAGVGVPGVAPVPKVAARRPSPPKARAPSPKRAPSPPKGKAPTPPPARKTARKRPMVAPSAINQLVANLGAIGIGNAPAAAAAPVPAPKRLTARQKSMLAQAAAKAKPAANRSKSPPKRRATRNVKKNAEKKYAQNLQAALVASLANNKAKQAKNNELDPNYIKALQESMFNL